MSLGGTPVAPAGRDPQGYLSEYRSPWVPTRSRSPFPLLLRPESALSPRTPEPAPS